MSATWFLDVGIHVFPTHNKVPRVPRGTSWQDYRCSREQAARYVEYAVVLGALGVIDTDNVAAEAWVTAHAPDTPFKVTTARGLHRYYRLITDAPHFVHRDDHVIEFRHVGQYVVGPGSVRPDGVTYVADEWSWNVNDVPVFPVADFTWDDRPLEARGSLPGTPYEFPDVVRAGERHEQLFRLLRSCKATGIDVEGTREIISMANARRCDPPLVEDGTFDGWFDRQWRKPDRPFAGAAPTLPRLDNGMRGLSWR